MVARRERGRTALQAAERCKKRATEEKALRDEENRLGLIEAQKVPEKRMPPDACESMLKGSSLPRSFSEITHMYSIATFTSSNLVYWRQSDTEVMWVTM